VGSLFVSVVAGAIGVAYLVYGRRQKKFVPLIAGVLLCTCPYFIDSLTWLCIVGALLMVAPFFIDLVPFNYPRLLHHA
jgi:hypothetical protein